MGARYGIFAGKSSSKIALKAFFIVILGFLSLFNRANASTYTEVYPVIDTNGTVHLGDVLSGTIYGLWQRTGTTPDVTQGNQVVYGSVNMGVPNYCSLEGGFCNGAGNTPNGNYIVFVTKSGSPYSPDWNQTNYYFKANRAGGLWYTLSFQDTTTHIISISSPINNATTTSPVNYQYVYYNGTDFPQTKAWADFTNLFTYATYETNKTTLIDGSNDISGNIELPDGNYQMLISSSDNNGQFLTFPSNALSFGVGTTTSTTTPATLSFKCKEIIAQYTTGTSTVSCGISNISGCVIDAGVSLFCPSDTSVNKILSIKDLIFNKPPIGYFTVTKNTLAGLNASTTPVLSFDIPDGLKTYIFDPIKIGLSMVILWFFIVHFYKKLSDIRLW